MRNITLNNYLKKRLRDPQFKKAWDESEAQYQITRELIKARLDKQVSQRTLAKKANTTQAVISRIENMTVSPSVGLLQKIASALGKKLEIRFVP